MLGEVFELFAVLGESIERRVLDGFVTDRNGKSAAECEHFVRVQLLLLVRRVAPFARFTQRVALDRLEQGHGWRAFVLGGRMRSGEALARVMPAAAHLLQLF